MKKYILFEWKSNLSSDIFIKNFKILVIEPGILWMDFYWNLNETRI